MKTLQVWTACMGGVVFVSLMAGLTAAYAGYPALSQMAIRLAVWLSVIGLAYAALMAVIIVWCEVHTGRALEQSPRTAVVPSATSSPRVTCLPAAPSMSDRRKTPLVAVAGGKGVAGCSSKGVH